MSIKMHLIITNVFLFSSFFLLGGFLFTSETTKELHMFFMFLIIVAVLTPAMNLLRGKLLAAKCPACGGRTFAKGYRPVRYACTNCDHVEVTKLSYGKRHIDMN